MNLNTLGDGMKGEPDCKESDTTYQLNNVIKEFTVYVFKGKIYSLAAYEIFEL